MIVGPKRSFTATLLRPAERRKVAVKQSRDESYKIRLCQMAEGEVHQRIYNTRRYDAQQVTHGVKLITVSDASTVTISTTDGQVHNLNELEGKTYKDSNNMTSTDWIKLLGPGSII